MTTDTQYKSQSSRLSKSDQDLLWQEVDTTLSLRVDVCDGYSVERVNLLVMKKMPDVLRSSVYWQAWSRGVKAISTACQPLPLWRAFLNSGLLNPSLDVQIKYSNPNKAAFQLSLYLILTSVSTETGLVCQSNQRQLHWAETQIPLCRLSCCM